MGSMKTAGRSSFPTPLRLCVFARDHSIHHAKKQSRWYRVNSCASAPLLLLDFSVRRQVTVYWGQNPSNERQNARPAGTIGCQIQAARSGIPTDEALWIMVDLDSESPLIHSVNETTPTTYAYRACYVGKNLKRGPYGDPAVCTVSV